MNKKFAILIGLFFPIVLFCQVTSYGDLGIKQRFDVVYNQMYGPIYDISSETNNINAQGSQSWNKLTLYTNADTEYDLGSTRAGAMEALLVMYEATSEMKYLWEFMESASQIINSRADKIKPQQSSSPYWFKEGFPYHGRILCVLSKFVYIVKSQNLAKTIIPISHQCNFDNKQNVGDFSNWVNISCQETMDYLLITRSLWRSNDECMYQLRDGHSDDGIPNISRTPSDPKTSDTRTYKRIMELNFQVPFGCALIYLYLANDNKRIDYGVKSIEMARAFCTSRNGILIYNSQYNAYSWWHNGWQWERNNIFTRKWHFYQQFQEDIGHAGIVIMFPLLYNKFQDKLNQLTGENAYFNDSIMVRFKNTFSNLIYNKNQKSPYLFNNNVFGGNDLTYYPASTQKENQNNAKLWMELYKFDSTSGSIGPNVYDIMMKYYIEVEQFAPIDNANYGGLNMKGLADMCAANYKNEKIKK